MAVQQRLEDSTMQPYRPAPTFTLDSQSFSTKKERKTPRHSAPPKPPAKSCPVTRIFTHRQPTHSAPVPVSFRPHVEKSFIAESPIYNAQHSKSYFEQCYEIEDKLGKGSFGEVYRVRCKESGKVYACKKTILKFRGDSDRRRRLAEVAKHEKLPKHANCVEFHRAWEEHQHLFILTEVCQKSLASLSEESPGCLPQDKVWKYALHLLQAIDHLHRHSLVHMDIKPENIFLSHDGTCKLGDFGLMFDMSKDNMSEAIEGDPKYMAPECLMSQFSPAADMFSLGITLLELALDLDLPTQGSMWQSLRQGVLPSSFSELSPSLQELLLGLLEPEPKKRLTAAQALLLPRLRRLSRQQRCLSIIKAGVRRLQALWSAVLACLVYVVSPVTTRVQERARLFHKLLSDTRDAAQPSLPATPPNHKADLSRDSFSSTPSRDGSFSAHCSNADLIRPFRAVDRQLSSTPSHHDTFTCSGPLSYSDRNLASSGVAGFGRRPLPSLPIALNLNMSVSDHSSLNQSGSRLASEIDCGTPCSSRQRSPPPPIHSRVQETEPQHKLSDLQGSPNQSQCKNDPPTPFATTSATPRLNCAADNYTNCLYQGRSLAPPTPQISFIVPATPQSSRCTRLSSAHQVPVMGTPTSQTLPRRLFMPSGLRQRSGYSSLNTSPVLGQPISRRSSVLSEDSVGSNTTNGCTSRNLMDLFSQVDCSDSE